LEWVQRCVAVVVVVVYILLVVLLCQAPAIYSDTIYS
jgi:hypothetical protein